ncbi:hypothetical protein EG834_15790, partial [bacterium]|nr:hypothetical protein [bacterium]
MKTNPNRLRRIIPVIMAVLVLLSGPACSVTLFDWPDINYTPDTPTPAVPTATPLTTTQVTFHAILPAALGPSETLSIRILDEVTGLGFNYSEYAMQARDALNYAVSIPLTLNSVVKYRYVRKGGSEVQETNAANQPIRYRLHSIISSTETTDLVAGWSDRPSNGLTGSVQGTAINSQNGAAIPNLLVSAGGIQAITDSAGRFILQGLPVGTHNVVGYSMDGNYTTFEQGATVAQGLATPVEVRVAPVMLAPVVFTVHVPENTQPGASVRMAGNLLQLGNTFSDLRGGLSVIADHMPVMNRSAEGIYNYTTNLPVGAHIEYKYTLGDGFWNAERTSNGSFELRQFIVPPTGMTIEDQVVTWQSRSSGPISFEVTVPPNTP